MQRIILPLLVLFAFARSNAQVGNDTIYIHPDRFILDDLVISANRWEQNLREVSNRISKISTASIELQNPQTAADLLSISNQVFIQKSQLGGGSPMIRGFSTNRVLLVIDGVRMNNAIFRSGNVQNVISLDPNAIGESEVIFGPGSVIYGSDAIGGVMDFHTLRPKFSESGEPASFEANGLLRTSSANLEKTAHIDFSISTSKLAFLTSITHSDYSDLFMGDHGPDKYTRSIYQRFENGNDVTVVNPNANEQIGSGYSQFNFMQKVHYRPNENWGFVYALHHSKTSKYGRYDRLILTKSDGTLSNGDWFYGPQKWEMHSIATHFNKVTAFTDHAKLLVAYQAYNESRHNRSFGSSQLTNRFEGVQALSFNLDLEKKLSESFALFYGFEWVNNEVSSTAFRKDIISETTTPVSTRYPNGSDWRSSSIYLSTKTKLAYKWLMNIGVRLNQVVTEATYDLTFFNFPFTSASHDNKALNGSVGFIYNPSSNWKWFTNLSSGFRAPNVDDIGKVFDSEPGNVIVPNLNLNPEQAYSVEIGATGKAAKNLMLDVSLFYTSINNAIARASSTFNGQDSILYDGQLSRVQSLQNISKVNVYGIQVGLNWNMSKELQLTSNINIQKGKEKDPTIGRNFSPTHVAPTFGAVHFIYGKNKWNADLYANYSGEISFNNLALSERGDQHLYAEDENGNPFSPSWATLNIKTSYKATRYVSADVGIENIFDKRYRPYSSGISAPGRNFIIAVRAKF